MTFFRWYRSSTSSMVTAPLFCPFFVIRLESRLSQNSSAKASAGTAECHAVWHNKAVATVHSYFKSVHPMFKRSKRHMTICNPSEAKTPVLAVSPDQLHCLTQVASEQMAYCKKKLKQYNGGFPKYSANGQRSSTVSFPVVTTPLPLSSSQWEYCTIFPKHML